MGKGSFRLLAKNSIIFFHHLDFDCEWNNKDKEWTRSLKSKDTKNNIRRLLSNAVNTERRQHNRNGPAHTPKLSTVYHKTTVSQQKQPSGYLCLRRNQREKGGYYC